VGSWKELGRLAGDFAAADVVVFGASADPPARLAAFRRQLELPFTMLSDPQLAIADALDVPRATKANLIATATLHPTVLTYPKRSFLQPSLFVWRRSGELVHQWRQTESSLTNLYGARGRPRGEQILEIVRRVVAGS